jgi:hypothetical protein
MKASINDLLGEFAALRGTEAEKAAWLRSRLVAFTEILAAEIESRLLDEPTFLGEQYNKALAEAAHIVRKSIEQAGLA